MKKPTKETRNWIISRAATVACLAAFFGFVYWLVFWAGSTKPIEAVAVEFRPNPKWSLESEHTEPPRALCIDVSCPHVIRTWASKDPVTKSEVITALSATGWQYKKSEPCADTDETVWLTCYFYGEKDGYKITLSISNINKASITLSIEEA